MTHTSTEQPELLPCPFCGAKAHFDIDDENWEWVECEGCGMQGNRSASLMEDCKPKLREEWNRRTPASQALVPLPESIPPSPTLWAFLTKGMTPSAIEQLSEHDKNVYLDRAAKNWAAIRSECIKQHSSMP